MRKSIIVAGMSCKHCVNRVEKALSEVEGISSISIDLENGKVEFICEKDISEEAIKELIEDAGYDVIAINTEVV